MRTSQNAPSGTLVNKGEWKGRGGIEGALLQGGPKFGDPLLELPQPGRGLRL
jgi:hypothetical protein